MSVVGAVRAARRLNDQTLTDRCTITRPGAAGSWDPVTGGTSGTSVTVYTGLPCRLREPSAAERASVAGEHQFQQGDAVLKLSAGTTGVRIGDAVTFTVSAQGVAMSDVWHVMWPVSGSHMSAARFVVRQVV